MSIRDRFNKLVGKDKVEPISEREAWRRSVVRDGNNDWQGLPIDRNAGAPISHRSERRGYRELVNDFLGLVNAKIEQRWNADIPAFNLNQFDQDASATEQAYDRRFDSRRTIASNSNYLRDGGTFKPE